MMHPTHKVTLRDIDIELTNRNEDDNDNDSNEESVMVHTESSDQSANDEERKDEKEETRGVWANKKEFFLAIVGYTVGIGSVWRFPIICSRNGGGAFLIPFFFFLITCGGPLYYLEVCIGQFSGISAGLAFEFCPLLKGLELLQVMLSLTVLWYVILIFDWALYFLYSSFNSVLPWTHCDNDWNTDKCVGIIETPASNSTFDHSHPTNLIHRNYSIVTLVNSTSDEGDTYNHTMASYMNDSEQSSSAFEFWEHHVLRKSRGLEEMGNIQFHLAICLLLSWMFCAAAVIKGVKVLGKVVYVTALAPYVLMSIFLIQGLTLDGAADGIKTYLSPDFSKLLTTQVWLDAAVQVFYSLGPTWGGVITMSSYNKFHQRTFWSVPTLDTTIYFKFKYNPTSSSYLTLALKGENVQSCSKIILYSNVVSLKTIPGGSAVDASYSKHSVCFYICSSSGRNTDVVFEYMNSFKTKNSEEFRLYNTPHERTETTLCANYFVLQSGHQHCV